jgi:hypothetical protein
MLKKQLAGLKNLLAAVRASDVECGYLSLSNDFTSFSSFLIFRKAI